MPTSTEKNNNTSPTAASTGTDLNGTAAVIACRQIRQRRAFAATVFDADVGDVLFAESRVSLGKPNRPIDDLRRFL